MMIIFYIVSIVICMYYNFSFLSAAVVIGVLRVKLNHILNGILMLFIAPYAPSFLLCAHSRVFFHTALLFL